MSKDEMKPKPRTPALDALQVRADAVTAIRSSPKAAKMAGGRLLKKVNEQEAKRISGLEAHRASDERAAELLARSPEGIAIRAPADTSEELVDAARRLKSFIEYVEEMEGVCSLALRIPETVAPKRWPIQDLLGNELRSMCQDSPDDMSSLGLGVERAWERVVLFAGAYCDELAESDLGLPDLGPRDIDFDLDANAWVMGRRRVRSFVEETSRRVPGGHSRMFNNLLAWTHAALRIVEGNGDARAHLEQTPATLSQQAGGAVGTAPLATPKTGAEAKSNATAGAASVNSEPTTPVSTLGRIDETAKEEPPSATSPDASSKPSDDPLDLAQLQLLRRRLKDRDERLLIALAKDPTEWHSVQELAKRTRRSTRTVETAGATLRDFTPWRLIEADPKNGYHILDRGMELARFLENKRL